MMFHVKLSKELYPRAPTIAARFPDPDSLDRRPNSEKYLPTWYLEVRPDFNYSSPPLYTKMLALQPPCAKVLTSVTSAHGKP